MPSLGGGLVNMVSSTEPLCKAPLPLGPALEPWLLAFIPLLPGESDPPEATPDVEPPPGWRKGVTFFTKLYHRTLNANIFYLVTWRKPPQGCRSTWEKVGLYWCAQKLSQCFIRARPRSCSRGSYGYCCKRY